MSNMDSKLSRRVIKMRIVDWYLKDTAQHFYENFFIKLLQKHYEIQYSENPDFIIYGPFGDSHLYYENAIKIFITFENVRTDWNVADFGMDFDYMEFGDRHLHLPLFMMLKDDLIKAINKHKNAKTFLAKKSKFCAFLASNKYGDKYRELLFYAINDYKKVDSGGKWLNNVGRTIGNREDENSYMGDKMQWLEGYKFNLCPENSSYPGYITEKIIHSFASGCVPIYWGDPTLCDITHSKERLIFNPKAFINALDFNILDDLVAEIRRIDNDEKAYFSMLLEPAFLEPKDIQKQINNSFNLNWAINAPKENKNKNQIINPSDKHLQDFIESKILNFLIHIIQHPSPKRVLFSQYKRKIFNSRRNASHLLNMRIVKDYLKVRRFFIRVWGMLTNKRND